MLTMEIREGLPEEGTTEYRPQGGAGGSPECV